MTELITNRETETTHIVANADAPDWKTDRAHCGYTGVARDLSQSNAEQAAEGLCETCRSRADESVIMELFETADEAMSA